MSGFAPRPITHGTLGGARLHYRRNEKPCDDCRAAKMQYQRGQTVLTGKSDSLMVPMWLLGDMLRAMPLVDRQAAVKCIGFKVAALVMKSPREDVA